MDGLIGVLYTHGNSCDSRETSSQWRASIGVNSNSGFNYASFLLGQVDFTVQPTGRAAATMPGDIRPRHLKVTRKLTLDYGLRYIYQTPLRSSTAAQMANFNAT
jgi:hypothetical protein